MRFDVVTIFPGMVEAGLAEGVVGRARDRGVIEVVVHNLRDYTTDRHHIVDDVPFGGGPGMGMKPEPFWAALTAISADGVPPDAVVLMTPAGRRLNEAGVRRFAERRHVVVLCGRYEGIDERVRTRWVTDEVSIGDYVLSGGELPALVLIDAVARRVPGVVGDEQSVEEDSFARGVLDYPHYTRPAVWDGMEVPEVLTSGHHKAIRQWRRFEALRRTYERRPDLLATAALDEEERAWLRAWQTQGNIGQ